MGERSHEGDGGSSHKKPQANAEQPERKLPEARRHDSGEDDAGKAQSGQDDAAHGKGASSRQFRDSAAGALDEAMTLKRPGQGNSGSPSTESASPGISKDAFSQLRDRLQGDRNQLPLTFTRFGSGSDRSGGLQRRERGLGAEKKPYDNPFHRAAGPESHDVPKTQRDHPKNAAENTIHANVIRHDQKGGSEGRLAENTARQHMPDGNALQGKKDTVAGNVVSDNILNKGSGDAPEEARRRPEQKGRIELVAHGEVPPPTRMAQATDTSPDRQSRDGPDDAKDDPADRVANVRNITPLGPPIDFKGVADLLVDSSTREGQQRELDQTVKPGGDSVAVTAETSGLAAAEKKDENVKITLEKKWGVADPTGDSKWTIKGKVALEHEESNVWESRNWKAGDLSAQINVGVHGKAESGVQVGAEGIGLYGKADVSSGLEAKAKLDHGAIGVDATAFAGEKAEVGGQSSFGPKGISAGAKVEAFLGESLRVEGRISGDVANVEAGAEAMAGIGAGAELKGSIGWDKTELKIKLGAVIGLGGKFNLGISFSPKGIATSVGDALSSLRGQVELFPHTLK